MKENLEFKVFCLESFKSEHGMTGEKAWDTFRQYDVFDYLESVVDVLHSTGRRYIVEDIDVFIRAKQHADS